ncbi:MAG: hypothetical protein AAB758_02490 [Patescibacteria group bacterium]
MNFFKRRHFLVSLVILVLAIASYFIRRDIKIYQNLVLGTEPDSKQVLDTEPGSGQNANQKDNTVASAEPKTPDLDRPIKINANLNDSDKERTISEIQEISGILKGDHDYFDGWLQLGILRKMIGDYDGAIEAWNFAGVIRPKSTISFLNSANIYAFYIRDNKNAEDSFLKAVSADPQNGFSYFQVARFYEDILKDKEKAKKILLQGISAGADATGDLKSLLDSI